MSFLYSNPITTPKCSDKGGDCLQFLYIPGPFAFRFVPTSQSGGIVRCCMGVGGFGSSGFFAFHAGFSCAPIAVGSGDTCSVSSSPIRPRTTSLMVRAGNLHGWAMKRPTAAMSGTRMNC